MRTLRAWFRPPRHLLALFLLITLVPSALLVFSGWRLLEQDAALRRQQAIDRREQAADVAVSSLQQAVDGVARDVLRGVDRSSVAQAPDAAIVVFARDGLSAFPERRLLYYPRTAAGREAPPATFIRGEAIERGGGSPLAAAAWFSALAGSPDAAVRAGARVREARNLLRAGRIDAALSALRRASEVHGAAVAGIPADLFAIWAECSLLVELQRTEQTRACGRRLHGELLSGRWQLDRAALDLHLHDAGTWAGGETSAPDASARALAAASDVVWRRWSDLEPGERSSGRDTVTVDGRRITLIWNGDADQVAALLAGPQFVDSQWLGRVRPAVERQGLTLQLRDPGVRARDGSESSRSASETGLPWTVAVAATGSGPADVLLAPGRQLWIAGLSVLAVIVVGGTVVIARAAARELAVARLQTDFVAAVSHEFRTPLTSMRQLTEVLKEGRVASEERKVAYYDALARQTDRLHKLVETLLDFGRMEAGTSPYRLESMDAAAWLRAVVEQFQQEPAARDHRIDLEVRIGAVEISADRSALTNALWNLLDNAVKYSPDATTVWVTADLTDRGQLAIGVRDEGLGIPPAEQKTIFGKFVRGADARARNIRGTGIGLAMVDHILKAHDGEIRVVSMPGTGSTFTLVMPCHAS